MEKLLLKKGDIYYVDLGNTKGSEVKKMRPCIIVQNDIGNRFAPTTIITPITHRKNKGQPTQVQISQDLLTDTEKTVDGMALAEQIRTVDRVRIKGKITSLNEKGINLLDAAILAAMGITGTRKEA